MRDVVNNVGIGKEEYGIFINSLNDVQKLTPVSLKFLDLLYENKRLYNLSPIIDVYLKFYEGITHKESIIVVSADDLNENEKKEVLSALQQSYKSNNIQVSYKTDSTIIGGLQIYTNKNFMDLSLQSRIEKVKEELYKGIH